MTPQKKRSRKVRVQKMIQKLKELYPKTGIALYYSNNWELAVAVILSAQTTDKKVNQVTEKLFKKYKTLDDYADAHIRTFQSDIKEIGLYKSKGKNIVKTARILREEYNGKLPNDIEKLIELPGIGRKTANVIMGVVHDNPVGIVVDTHVRRFAIRFDLSDYKDPDKIEKDLMEIIPPSEWQDFTFRMIDYGRDICPARPHDCSNHPLTLLYPKASKIWPKAK